ncbi:MAG: hypothetical protein ABIH46_04330 [Chloroflexota bacterium]
MSTLAAGKNLRILLNPIGEVEFVDMGLALRVNDLKGKTIGFLDNSKWNAQPLLARTEELIRAKYEIKGVFHTRKLRASGSSQDMDELAKCDAVVAGIGL